MCPLPHTASKHEHDPNRRTITGVGRAAASSTARSGRTASLGAPRQSPSADPGWIHPNDKSRAGSARRDSPAKNTWKKGENRAIGPQVWRHEEPTAQHHNERYTSSVSIATRIAARPDSCGSDASIDLFPSARARKRVRNLRVSIRPASRRLPDPIGR